MRRTGHRRPGRLAGAVCTGRRARRRGDRLLGEAVTSPGAGDSALIAETGARGLAGDLFVDGALGSRTAWLREPYQDAPDCTGNCYLDVAAIDAHVRACTEAGVTGWFPRHRRCRRCGGRRSVRAGRRRPRRRLRSPAAATGWSIWRWSPRIRPPSWAPGASSPACRPAFDAVWGGGDGMYAAATGCRPRRPAQPARAVSIPRRASRVRFGRSGHTASSRGRACALRSAPNPATARCRGGPRSPPRPAAAGGRPVSATG